jgi:hypothetical protein
VFVAAFSLLPFASPSSAVTCNADVDGDGDVDLSDLAIVYNCYAGIIPPTAACDVNCDGVVGAADVEIVGCWGGLLGGLPGGEACCTEVRSCCLGVECADTTPENCKALGGTPGPILSSCAGTPVAIVEPGGSVFMHHIFSPAECPVVPQPAPRGQPCDLGDFFLDPWMTTGGLSCHNFGVVGSPAIPADFFGPGSEPFTGEVCFSGTPSGHPSFPDADTIIRRIGPFEDFCDIDAAPTFDIEIVALSLVSVDPISVVVDGTPEDWDVAVGLSSVAAPLGTLTTTRTHCNGGTYTSTLRVLPKFTFTKVSEPGQVLTLDTGEEGIPAVVLSPPFPKDWSIDLPPGIDGANYCTSFHPGFRTGVAVSCDCNENGIRDTCDIRDGLLHDANSNGIPDECEGGLAAPVVAPQAVSLVLVPAMPNPTKAATTLMYALGRDQPVTLTIHDVRGRVIRSLVEEAQSPGAHTVQWDGRDESGKPVPPSVYYARLSCEEGTRTTRIAVIR